MPELILLLYNGRLLYTTHKYNFPTHPPPKKKKKKNKFYYYIMEDVLYTTHKYNFTIFLS